MEQREATEAPKPISRSKMPDKALPESHREYLDMDTDEEEFGHQETPEPLDEAPPEPDKPDYTSEELDALVDHVKSLTVIADITESNWTTECLETIRLYFREPTNALLTIRFSGDQQQLRARLGLPSLFDDDDDDFDDGRGIVYFLRDEPWQIFRADDFLDVVTFGSIDGKIERSLLRMIEGVYAPLVFEHDQWPDIKRDEIFTNVNDCLVRAIDLTYTPMGILMLYSPWEGIKPRKRCSETIRDQEQLMLLINRLEKVARNWIKQIREALLIKIDVLLEDELYDVKSEFEFWRSRYENLTIVSKQMSSSRIKFIVKRLKRVESSSVRDLKLLSLKVKEALILAESNLTYLDLVLDSCKSFNDPKLIREFAPKILHVVRFVWTKSSYYGEAKNIERLLCSLSVYVAKICIESIALNSIFDEPKKCRRIVETSLRCCDSYSKIYDDIIAYGMENESNWETDKRVVFNCLNIFEQRCHDVIEICDAIIIYGSLNKINLGGTRGHQHEIQYRRVKERFAEITNEMRIVCNSALNIKKIKWFDYMSKFRRDVAQLENTMKNLFNDLFEDVGDVEMGIETLYTLLKFKDRRGFQDILHDKWTQVWKLFYEDIKICSSTPMVCEIIQDGIKLGGSEEITESRINKNYLSRLHKMMIDASDWLGDCDMQFVVLKYLNAK